MLNAADILSKGSRVGSRTAIVHPSGDVTYAELRDLIAKASGALMELGLARGNSVAFLMKDTPLFCAVFLAVARMGGVALPLNSRLAVKDLAFIVRDSGSRFLVADEELLSLGRTVTDGTEVTVIETADLARRLERAVRVDGAVETNENEPAFCLYSSGTTGRPKAILHSHRNLARAGKILRDVVHADEHTKILVTSKLFFAAALDVAFTGALSCGGTTILNDAWPTPEQVVEQVDRHRPHVLLTVPTFYRRLLALGSHALAPFSSIRFTLTGGERLPDSVYEQWRGAVGTEILAGYGMSETFCHAFSNFPDRNHSGTCGYALSEVSTKLLDAEGREVRAGEPGTLWIRHPSLALGYKDPLATEKVFRDGWFCTNDVFACREDGAFQHQGRADELYKVAGMWVKPSEVEDIVLAAGLAREAACVVARDVDGFERLALFVVRAEGSGTAGIEAAVRERCDAVLPSHARPKWVREISELPRTATGKVQHFLLRERLTTELTSR